MITSYILKIRRWETSKKYLICHNNIIVMLGISMTKCDILRPCHFKKVPWQNILSCSDNEMAFGTALRAMSRYPSASISLADIWWPFTVIRIESGERSLFCYHNIHEMWTFDLELQPHISVSVRGHWKDCMLDAKENRLQRRGGGYSRAHFILFLYCFIPYPSGNN